MQSNSRPPGNQQGQKSHSRRFHRPKKAPLQGRPQNSNQNANQNANQGTNQNQRSQHPHSMPFPEVLKKYHHHFDTYLQGRKKYFEMFYRAQNQGQRDKIKNAYDRSLEELRGFLKKLPPFLRERLLGPGRAHEDLTYTLGRTEAGQEILSVDEPKPPYHDPHLTASQIRREDFRSDREESSGTMFDYQKIKGL